MNTRPITLVWFRRDLRLFDNTALQTAVRRGLPLAGVFVEACGGENSALQQNLRRAGFIAGGAAALQADLAAKNVPLYILRGAAEVEIPRLAHTLNAAAVVCAESCEPQERGQENRLWRALDAAGRELVKVEDMTVLPRAAVMAHTGRPYSNYAAYKADWLQTFARRFDAWQPADDWHALAALQQNLPASARIFAANAAAPPPRTAVFEAGEAAARAQSARFFERIGGYAAEGGFPAKNGTSRLSPYLAHGMLSPRSLAQSARQRGAGGAAWLEGLIRRDFYLQFLYHFPETAGQGAYPEYRAAAWHNNAEWLERWKHGQTGYPIVDAAMRHLAGSGWLHPRLRLLAAGFLTRYLLTDPRLGEAWFAQQSTDYDLAAACGGWRSAAGADAARGVFNPVLQSQQADPDGRFIRRHVPELAHLGKEVIHAPWLAKESIRTHGYPAPVADPAAQRKLAAAFSASIGRAV